MMVKDINGLTIKNLTIPEGELNFTNCTNSDIEGITAPKSKLKVTGSRTNTKFSKLSVSQ